MDQAITGEVLMGVDVPRGHKVSGGANDNGVGMKGTQRRELINGGNLSTINENRPVFNHPPCGVHRDDGTPDELHSVEPTSSAKRRRHSTEGLSDWTLVKPVRPSDSVPGTCSSIALSSAPIARSKAMISSASVL